jgi:deoxyribodipyrimidine photolyase-related protein
MSFFESLFRSNPHSEINEWIYIHPDQLNPSLLQHMLSEKSGHQHGYIFVESSDRWRQLPFHKKRIIFEISAMRHLAISLVEAGFAVHYAMVEVPFEQYLDLLLKTGSAPTQGYFSNPTEPPVSNLPFHLHVMRPASHDEGIAASNLSSRYQNDCSLHQNSFFLANIEEYRGKISPGYRMEFFYRDIRRKLNLLMDVAGQPAGGDWNYDKENRKSLPRNIDLPIFPKCEPDCITTEVVRMVSATYPNHFGTANGFSMAVTRYEADQLSDHFFESCLPLFGPYEDAMAKGEIYVFHSSLSAYLNVGLLDPLQLCKRAEQAWHDGHAPLHSVEGFIRQISGWREFVRIYYEAMMPAVRNANALEFNRELPSVFWTADSGMACIDDIAGGVIEHGWSHHIPRLMVLSNFSNLTQTNPFLLYQWFWYAYTDAHDWVVLPNVLGMSTFADGGILASKPYVSGGNYINKMSNYCASCKYSIKEKTGELACPFNYLYWNFVDRHRDVFNDNGRVSFMVNMFDKRSEQEKQAVRQSAMDFIEQLPRWNSEQPRL